MSTGRYNPDDPHGGDKVPEKSDGSTASYYELPKDATQLQHLISHVNMNAQIGEIFRACYRYGRASHSDMLRDAKKIKFYAEAEIERLDQDLADKKAIVNRALLPSHACTGSMMCTCVECMARASG